MKTHTKIMVLAAALLLASSPSAWADEELQAKYDEKVAKEFVAHGGWLLDYDKALEKAAGEKKYIFAYFTRSYST